MWRICVISGMATRTVVLASLLKPVDDVRMYEKFGVALTQLPELSIHIIGFVSKRAVSHPGITFHPLFNFPRLSVQRFTASWKYYKMLVQLKPDIIVVTSADLLIVTSIYKILFGSIIIYDVQENYYCNLLHMGTFSFPVNYFLAASVRIAEWLTRPFIFRYFLAEKVYCKELQFTRNKRTVVENKYHPVNLATPLPLVTRKSRFHLLYTGTISEQYGVYRAIQLVKALYAIDSRYQLTIVGYCAKASEYVNLLREVNRLPFVELIGGNYLVPHSEILTYIQTCGAGLLPYLPNVCTANRIPTKLYEYLYYQLPVLLPHNPLWLSIADSFNGSLPVDFEWINADMIHQQLSTMTFYTDTVIIKDSPTLLWDSKSIISIFSKTLKIYYNI